jgi:hypothetical protein
MTKWGILVPVALVALFFMASCQPAIDLSGYAKKTDIPTGSTCTTCHAGDTPLSPITYNAVTVTGIDTTAVTGGLITTSAVNGLAAGNTVYFGATTIPTGLSVDTPYLVLTVPSTTTLTVASLSAPYTKIIPSTAGTAVAIASPSIKYGTNATPISLTVNLKTPNGTNLPSSWGSTNFTGTALANYQAWYTSGHATGPIVAGTGGGYHSTSALARSSQGCSKCHTTNGFQNWANVGSTSFVATAAAWARSNSARNTAIANDTATYTSTDANGQITKKVYRADVTLAFLSTPAGSVTPATFEANAASVYTTGAITKILDVTYTNYQSVKNYAILADGTVFGVPAATDGITCLACHSHNNNGLDVQLSAGVPLPSGMTSTSTSAVNFNSGAGNLCVNCHQDLSTPDAKKNSSFVKNSDETYYKFAAPHHGTQSDFLLGADSSGKTSAFPNGYATDYASGTGVPSFATSGHYMGDSCVACHVTKNTTNGHSMYLAKFDDTNAQNLVCASCHAGVTVGAATFEAAMPAAYATKLANIVTAEEALIAYFADVTKFYTTATGITTAGASSAGTTSVQAPIYNASITAAPYTTYTFTPGDRFGNQWKVSSALYGTLNQTEAFWNLVVYEEDRSQGIHNATYAAQLLYDAQMLVGLTPAAALKTAAGR